MQNVYKKFIYNFLALFFTTLTLSPTLKATQNDTNNLDNTQEQNSVQAPINTPIQQSPQTDDISTSSGLIIGLDFGYSAMQFIQNYETQTTIVQNTPTAQGGTTTTTTITPIQYTNTTGNGVSYGLIIGYQGFWKKLASRSEIGMRIYGDFNAINTHFKTTDSTLLPLVLRYGFNIDTMFNFLVSENALGLGGFVGLRLGGKSYFGKDIDSIDKQMRELNGRFPLSSFDFGVHLGARANIAKNHGIELIFTLPIFNTHYQANTSKVTKTNTQTTTTNIILNGDIKELWSVGVRYIYTFEGLK